jgi:prophage regulatory protein
MQTATFDRSRHVPPPEVKGECLLRFPVVAERVGLSRTSIYGFIKGGTFPDPVKTGRGSRWLASEIDAWIAARANERPAKAA